MFLGSWGIPGSSFRESPHGGMRHLAIMSNRLRSGGCNAPARLSAELGSSVVLLVSG